MISGIKLLVKPIGPLLFYSFGNRFEELSVLEKCLITAVSYLSLASLNVCEVGSVRAAENESEVILTDPKTATTETEASVKHFRP